ncbi:MAG: hypothetical protein AAF351_13700 [Pseudomonadota bacterium]
MQAKHDTTIRMLAAAVGLVFLAGCANEGGRTLDKVGRHEVAEYAGCSNDQVAMCIDTNCEPDEFQCVDRGDAHSILGVPEFPRNR